MRPRSRDRGNALTADSGSESESGFHFGCGQPNIQNGPQLRQFGCGHGGVGLDTGLRFESSTARLRWRWKWYDGGWCAYQPLCRLSQPVWSTKSGRKQALSSRSR